VLHQASVGTLSGAQEYSKTLNAGLWAAVVQIVGVAAVALARGSVRSLLVVAFLASVVPAWLTSRAVVRFATPKSSLDSAPKQYARVQPRVRRFWLAASCTALIDLVIWQRSGLFFLKLFAPLPQLALYAIAFSISDRLSTIGAIMTGALMPLFSEIHANMDHERLFALYTKALKYVQMVMLPACLFGIIVARPIVYLLCGRSYAEAAPVLQVVLASLAVTGLGPVVYALILSVGKEMFLVRVGVPVAALNVVLSLLLIPRGWALGAAIANGSVQVVDTVLALLCAHRIAGHFPLRSFARICISGLAGAVPLLYICRTSMNDLGKLAFVIPAGLLYLLALTAWREIGEKEFNLFRRLVSSAVARRASSNPP
jgi:O-antigen/teichoic acid export membrane protein